MPESDKVDTYACDCSASGMLAVRNTMSCLALVRKLVFVFYDTVTASQKSIVLFRLSDLFSTPHMSHNMVKRLDVI